MTTNSHWVLQDQQAQLTLDGCKGRVDLRRPQHGLTQLQLPGGEAIRQNILGVCLRTNPAPDAAFACQDAYARGHDLIATYPQTEQQQHRVQIYWRAGTDQGQLRVYLEVSVQTSLADARFVVDTRSMLLGPGELLRLSDPNQDALLNQKSTASPVSTAKQNSTANQESAQRINLESAAAVGFGPADGIGCFVWRPPGADHSYVEMVHPVDFLHSRLACESAWEPMSDNGVNSATAAEPPRHTTAEETISPDAVILGHRLFDESLEKGVIRRTRVAGAFVDRQNDLTRAARLYSHFAQAEPVLTS
jgi:hypothetical protein